MEETERLFSWPNLFSRCGSPALGLGVTWWQGVASMWSIGGRWSTALCCFLTGFCACTMTEESDSPQGEHRKFKSFSSHPVIPPHHSFAKRMLSWKFPGEGIVMWGRAGSSWPWACVESTSKCLSPFRPTEHPVPMWLQKYQHYVSWELGFVEILRRQCSLDSFQPEHCLTSLNEAGD